MIRILNDHTYMVRGLAVLKNGYFVSISDDNTAIIWDSSSFTKITILRTNASYGFWSVSSYFDNSFIIADSNRAVKVWDSKYFGFNFLENFQSNNALSLSFFNTNFLLTGLSDGKIQVLKFNPM